MACTPPPQVSCRPASTQRARVQERGWSVREIQCLGGNKKWSDKRLPLRRMQTQTVLLAPNPQMGRKHTNHYTYAALALVQTIHSHGREPELEMISARAPPRATEAFKFSYNFFTHFSTNRFFTQIFLQTLLWVLCSSFLTCCPYFCYICWRHANFSVRIHDISVL